MKKVSMIGRVIGRALRSICLATLLVVAPRLALAETLTVRVTGSDGAPLPGVGVRVVDANGRETTTETGRSGTASVDIPPGDTHVTVFLGNRLGGRTITVGPGQSPRTTIGSEQLVPAAATANAAMMQGLVDAANRAADACDRAGYRLAVDRLNLLHGALRGNLARRQSELDYFRFGRGLPASVDSMDAFRALQLASGTAGTAVMTLIEGEFRAVLQRRDEARTALETFERIRAQLKPFPEDCDKEKKVGQLPGTFAPGGSGSAMADGAGAVPASVLPGGKYGFYAGFEIGGYKVDRPSTSYFRIDRNGEFKRFPAVRFDADLDTDVRYQFEAGYVFGPPWGGRSPTLAAALRAWYFDGSGSDAVDQLTPGMGKTFGLFSPPTQQMPFGGYSTGQPLTDLRYRTSYENYGGELLLQGWWSYGNLSVAPSLGLALGRTNVTDSLGMGIGAPAFTTFDQSTKIGSTYFGPTIGVAATYEVGDGFYLHGKANFGVQFHDGDGRWSTFVPLVDDEPRTQKLSQSKTAFAVGGQLGVGYRIGGLDARLSFDLGHSNGSPYLKYGAASDTETGTGGAKIGYGSQTEYGVNFGLRYSF